jgi:hypothetical protein
MFLASTTILQRRAMKHQWSTTSLIQGPMKTFGAFFWRHADDRLGNELSASNQKPETMDRSRLVCENQRAGT